MIGKRILTMSLIILMAGQVVAQRKGPEMIVQTGHNGNPESLRLSQDNRWLASSDDFGIVKVWDFRLKRLIKTINLETRGFSTGVAWSADSKKLFLKSYGTLQWWDLQTDSIHRVPFEDLDFLRPSEFALSPSGNLVATGYVTLQLFDTHTGKKISTADGYMGKWVWFINNDEELIVATTKEIKLFRVSDGKQLKQYAYPEDIQKYIHGSDFMATYNSSGNSLLVGRNQKWFVFDIRSFSITQTMEVKGYQTVHTIQPLCAPDEFVLLGTDSLYTFRDNRLERRLMKTGTYVSSKSTLSNDCRYFAFFNQASKDILVYNLDTYSLYHNFSNATELIQDIAYNHKSQRLATCGDGNLTRVWNLGGQPIMTSWWNYCKYVDFSSGGDRLAISSGSGSMFDEQNAMMQLSSNIMMKKFMAMNSYMGLDEKPYREKEAEVEKRMALVEQRMKDSISQVFMDFRIIDLNTSSVVMSSSRPQIKTHDVIFLSDDEIALVVEEEKPDLKNEFFIEIWDIKKNKRIQKSIGFPATIGNLFIANNNGSLAINRFSHQLAMICEKEIWIFSLPSLKIIKKIKPVQDEYSPLSIAFSHDGKKLACGYGIVFGMDTGFITEFETSGYTPIASQDLKQTAPTDLLFSPDGHYLIATEGNVAKVYTDIKKPPSKFFLNRAERFVKVRLAGDNILMTTENGLILMYDLQSPDTIVFAEKIKMVSPKADAFLISTPENYLFASKNAFNAVAYRHDGKTLLPDQFDLQYNRPDIVLSRIGAALKELTDAYRKAYDKRLKKMGFDPAAFLTERTSNAPVVSFANRLPAYSAVKDSVFKFSINATDSLYSLDRISIDVNGVPLSVKGLDLKSEQLKKVKKEFRVNLSQGMNMIRISALNEKGVESLKEQIQVEYRPAVPRKPNLHVITIGVSTYQQPGMNLDFAAKDASDIASAFSPSTAEYGNVYLKTLTDRDVRVENVLALKKYLMNTGVNDKVIVTYAGHGLLDNDMNYYLATFDVDFTNPSARGLRYEDFEDLLSDIPSRNKLIVIDACHSGEIDKEDMQLSASSAAVEGKVTFRAVGNKAVKNKTVGLANSFEVMKELFTDLRKNNGAVAITSASGAEYAVEGTDWKNGVFTYCMLEGLKSMNADLNGDGSVQISELQEYVQSKVPRLTAGKQQPTSRIENIENDWIVWKP